MYLCVYLIKENMEFKTITTEPNYEISKEGIIRNSINGKIKSQYIGTTGYYMISISHNNKSKPLRVHRLIAEAFIDNPDRYKCINHLNGIKTDNSIENLEWCSHIQNMQHAFNTGLANNTGEKNGQCKLTSKQVSEIKQRLISGESQYSIAKDYPVTRSVIEGIKIGRLWKNL